MMTIHLLHEKYFTRIFWENTPPKKIFILVPVHTVLQRRAVRWHLGPPPVMCLHCLYSSCLVPESAISPHWPLGIMYSTGLWNKRGTFSQLDASKIFEIAAICYRKVFIPLGATVPRLHLPFPSAAETTSGKFTKELKTKNNLLSSSSTSQP